jgi:hypothetical protein
MHSSNRGGSPYLQTPVSYGEGNRIAGRCAGEKIFEVDFLPGERALDRKSTRLNSSHW